jgi:hypothetical protein
VKLLALDRIDVRHLVARYPELAERMKPAILVGEG